jgi:DNA-binding NarL/FixJ family response regulator
MIRVLLVNEVELTCNLIATVLEDEEDMQVVGCTGSPTDALDQGSGCDVALVSPWLRNERSLSLVSKFKEEAPGVKVLMLGLTETEDQVLPYVQAGAAGYILPDASVSDMLHRIRAATANQALVSPEIAAALIERVGELMRENSALFIAEDVTAGLTPRELEILYLIDEGLTNQEIADHLVIEVGTVKNHVHNILQKLDATNRHEAALYLASAAGGGAK